MFYEIIGKCTVGFLALGLIITILSILHQTIVILINAGLRYSINKQKYEYFINNLNTSELNSMRTEIGNRISELSNNLLR